MDFKKIKVGNILNIKGKNYEVIGSMEDVVCLPPKYKFRNTLYFDLLEKESKRITPTHCLVYYFDTKKAYFSSEEKDGHELKKGEIKIIS